MKGFLMAKSQKKTEKSPDFSGIIEIGDVKYDVSGWTKQSKKGAEYISLALKEKKEVPAVESQDGIPF